MLFSWGICFLYVILKLWLCESEMPYSKLAFINHVLTSPNLNVFFLGNLGRHWSPGSARWIPSCRAFKTGLWGHDSCLKVGKAPDWTSSPVYCCWHTWSRPFSRVKYWGCERSEKGDWAQRGKWKGGEGLMGTWAVVQRPARAGASVSGTGRQRKWEDMQKQSSFGLFLSGCRKVGLMSPCYPQHENWLMVHSRIAGIHISHSDAVGFFEARRFLTDNCF